MSIPRLILSAAISLAILLLLHSPMAHAAEQGAPGATRVALAFRNVGDGQPAKGFTLKDTAGKDTSLSEASGKVVVLVGVTLAAGVATWALSPIKFQADMGILLAFMFVWNMVGAVVLIPALSRFLLPRAA